MTNKNTVTSLRKIGKIAGVLFLLSLIVPLLHWSLVLSKLIVAENAMDTVHNIMANEALFRIGIINELIISVVVLSLGLVLYAILKSVNKNLALLALSLKFTEAILWAVIALGSHTALLVLNEKAPLNILEPGKVQALVGLFLNAHIPATAIPGIFLGLNSMIFFFLLYKSKYVPGALAVFGVFSYALIFIYDLTNVFFPDYATRLSFQLAWSGPSILFEIFIGLWLLVKGLNLVEPKSLN